jgi:colicin import membrane protein
MNEPAAQSSTAVIAPTIEDAMRKVTLPQDGAAALREAFAPHFQKVHEIAAQAATVKPDEPKKARAARLALREVRCAAENTRKAQKEDSLRRGKAIDGIYNVLEYQVVPMEQALQQIEDAEEIRERNRKAALAADRSEKLRPFMDPTHMSLGEMDEQAFDLLLSGARTAHQNKIDQEAREKAQREADERKAAADRAAKEEADRVERERLKAENERLAKEAEQRRAEQEAKDREAAAERQRLAAQAEADRRKAEIAEAEARRLRDAAMAEAVRLADEKAAKEKAEQEAKAKAARAPEKAKVAKLAADIRALQIPDATSIEGKALVAQIQQQVTKFAHWLDVEGGRL